MTAAETDWTVTAPGVVHGMPFDVYLADPVTGRSLSHSGAKTLMKATPALFAYEREHGRPSKRDFDFGHAAHQTVLGVGPKTVIVQRTYKDGAVEDAANYNTVSAQQHRDDIYAAGDVPLLRQELEVVNAMADRIRAHPVASKLLAPGAGQPEASAFARDPDTTVAMRCRYDWLRQPSSAGRLLLVDYKTCAAADEDSFGKSAANYGYDLQDAWYTQVAHLLGLADDIKFLFIAQEKSAPFLVNVVQLDITARRIGQHLMRRALATYAECEQSGVWPGYGDDINLISLPAWYERAFEMELA